MSLQQIFEALPSYNKSAALCTTDNPLNGFSIMGTLGSITAQKIKFSIKDFFSKCDQIRRFLQIWSHLLKKSLMENFIFCAVWMYEFLQ